MEVQCALRLFTTLPYRSQSEICRGENKRVEEGGGEQDTISQFQDLLGVVVGDGEHVRKSAGVSWAELAQQRQGLTYHETGKRCRVTFALCNLPWEPRLGGGFALQFGGRRLRSEAHSPDLQRDTKVGKPEGGLSAGRRVLEILGLINHDAHRTCTCTCPAPSSIPVLFLSKAGEGGDGLQQSIETHSPFHFGCA